MYTSKYTSIPVNIHKGYRVDGLTIPEPPAAVNSWVFTSELYKLKADTKYVVGKKLSLSSYMLPS